MVACPQVATAHTVAVSKTITYAKSKVATDRTGAANVAVTHSMPPSPVVMTATGVASPGVTVVPGWY